MASGPVPQHERTWRHPSELAAEERRLVTHSAPTPTARVMAIASGTVGLVAIGLFVFTVSPRRAESPLAISASTVPVTSGRVAAVVRGAGDAVGRLAPFRNRSTPPDLATPIGDGRLALLTPGGSVPDAGTQIEVQLSSGPVVTAVVSYADADLVAVTIDATPHAHPIASAQPTDDEIVTVLAEPPVTVAFADVGDVDAANGTPVLDEQGKLIGLCKRGAAAMELVDVTGQADAAEQPVAATTAAP